MNLPRSCYKSPVKPGLSLKVPNSQLLGSGEEPPWRGSVSTRSGIKQLPARFPPPSLPTLQTTFSLPLLPIHIPTLEMPGWEHHIGHEGLGQLLCLLAGLNKQRAVHTLLVNTKA